MKRFLLISLGSLVLMGLVGACRPNDPDPGFGPNGQARILALTAPGLQATDVVIDQAAHQITLTLPTSFSADYLPVRLKLTPDSRTITQATVGNVADSLWLYVLKNPDLSTISVDRISQISNPLSERTTYQVSFRQNGPLSFQSLTQPLSFTVNPHTVCVTLPVYNFMDDQLDATLTLTNRQSGTQLSFPQTPDFSSTCYGNTRYTDGAVGVHAYFNANSFYEAGDYSVELTKPNGRRAQLAQPLRIVRGAVEAYFSTDYPLLVGQPAEVVVANLRPTDQPSFVFRSRGQPPLTIEPIGFTTSQPGLLLGPVSRLQAGYYYVQLLTNGQPTPSFNRVIVEQGHQLVITGFYRESATAEGQRLFSPSESFEIPVTLVRGQTYVPSTNAYTFYANGTDAARPRFAVFTSLTNPDQQYSVGLVSDRFTLPATIPPGRYQFLFRLVRPDGSPLDSLPFERDIVIQ